MIWARGTRDGRSGAGRASAGAERRRENRARRKNRPPPGRLRALAGPDFFAAADFLAGAPRRPGARPAPDRPRAQIILVLG